MTSGTVQYGIRPLDYKIPIRMSVETQIEAAYRVTACEKEPWTVEFIEAQPPGTWFIDVGANVGSYTLVAIANGLKPVAIEPSPDSVFKLVKNLRLNDWADRAIVLWAGLSSETAFDYISLDGLEPGGNEHVMGKHRDELTKHAMVFHTHVIPVMRLDDLVPLLGPPDVPIAIKIDVDGGEDAVIKGGREALKSPQVRSLLIELDKKNEHMLGELLEMGWKEKRRIDENTPLVNTSYGHVRFEHMFYIWLEK